MAPAQFITRCVTNCFAGRNETRRVSNFEHPVELPHLAEICHIESPPEIRREPPRQILQQRLAVCRAPPAALLVLHDQPPDLPARLHHRRVDRTVGAGAHRFENGTDLAVERLGRRDACAGISLCPGRHVPSVSKISRWNSSSHDFPHGIEPTVVGFQHPLRHRIRCPGARAAAARRAAPFKVPPVLLRRLPARQPAAALEPERVCPGLTAGARSAYVEETCRLSTIGAGYHLGTRRVRQYPGLRLAWATATIHTRVWVGR